MRKHLEITSPKSCIAHAHPQEMVFVLLGRDAAAPAAIRAWVSERVRLGKNATGPDRDQLVEALECAKTMESEGRQWVGAATHYPLGMGEESRRLHRAYSDLLKAQLEGAKNGAEVVRLTDECAAKGIIPVVTSHE